MSDKKIAIIIFLFIIVAAVSGGLLYFKYSRDSEKVAIERQDFGTNTIVAVTGDVIQKSQIGDAEGVSYRIEGSFTDLSVMGTILQGSFVIKDDTAYRKIKVFVGTNRESVQMGKFQGSFDGSSLWRIIPQSEALQQIVNGEPVLLQVDLRLTGNDNLDKAASNKEKIMDELTADFKNKKYSYIIPDDFYMLSEKVGVIVK